MSDQLPTVPGVYRIAFEFSSDSYIGSAQNIRQRCGTHLYELLKQKHSNIGLQAMFDKCGRAAVRFVVIELCPAQDRRKRERHWLKTTKPTLNRNATGDTITPKKSTVLVQVLVNDEERAEIIRHAGDSTLSQYLRKLCGFPPMKRGRRPKG